jgi:hypothetical protein
MKVADTGSFFLDPSVTHWDDTLTIVIPLRVSGIYAKEIPRRYDVEAILLYSPTQYPIWIPVSGHWDDTLTIVIPLLVSGIC